jgi:hypothetical protein
MLEELVEGVRRLERGQYLPIRATDAPLLGAFFTNAGIKFTDPVGVVRYFLDPANSERIERLKTALFDTSHGLDRDVDAIRDNESG